MDAESHFKVCYNLPLYLICINEEGHSSAIFMGCPLVNESNKIAILKHFQAQHYAVLTLSFISFHHLHLAFLPPLIQIVRYLVQPY